MGFITTEILSYFAEKFSEKITSIFAKKTDIPTSLPANGGDASTVNGQTVAANVPSEAKFTDTVYAHPATAGNKHIPAGGTSGQILRWSADGTAVWGDDNNTIYSNATTSEAGLMSTADKTKLDGIDISAATTADIDKIIAGTFS